MKKLLYTLAGIILIGVAGIQIYYNLFNNQVATKNVSLEEAISKDIPGWTSEKLPLAQTEEMLNRVDDILNFDEHISRVYKNNRHEFVLYAAYWKPGKTSVKEVHTHTPDICWVGNGWKRLESDYNFQLKVNDKEIKPGQKRLFEKNGNKMHVVFWHVVGDSIYHNKIHERGSYSFNSIVSLFKYGIDTRKEQIFLRISSQLPIEDILKSPDLEKIKQELVALCLENKTATTL